MIWQDATIEMGDTNFWSKYDVARMTSDASMLDIIHTSVGVRERFATLGNTIASTAAEPPAPAVLDADPHPTVPVRVADTSAGKPLISLQDMVTASVALKSRMDVSISKAATAWPNLLFANGNGPGTSPSSPSPSHQTLPGDTASITTTDVQNSSRVAQALASLQREVVLLRNELNFELWLSRENVKNIGRLYQDRTLYRSAETERQALVSRMHGLLVRILTICFQYNKLRKYRTQVNDLERQLREHKQLASSTKNKFSEWNMELAQKLKQLREAQKVANDEKAALRQAEKQAKVRFDLFMFYIHSLSGFGCAHIFRHRPSSKRRGNCCRRRTRRSSICARRF